MKIKSEGIKQETLKNNYFNNVNAEKTNKKIDYEEEEKLFETSLNINSIFSKIILKDSKLCPNTNILNNLIHLLNILNNILFIYFFY